MAPGRTWILHRTGPGFRPELAPCRPWILPLSGPGLAPDFAPTSLHFVRFPASAPKGSGMDPVGASARFGLMFTLVEAILTM